MVSEALDDVVVPLVALAVALVLAAAAEALHARRVRRLAGLAFGPSRRARWWARAAPGVRVLGFGGVAWGFSTLLLLPPKHYAVGEAALAKSKDPHHIVLVLDVSPSMRLVDAGSNRKLSRMERARELMDSFFDRVPAANWRISVVAFFTGAKPVVVDTQDLEVVRNILGDLPMNYAFTPGRTKLFEGLEAAARIAKPWAPRSTTVVLVSDGDTVPATGMPRMPESVRAVLVVGVGDATTGRFIDGRQSRQDVPVLRQIAARLGGAFHNGNERHLSSALIQDAAGFEAPSLFERLTRREYALIASFGGAALLSLLPWLLVLFGTAWNPGVRRSRRRDESSEESVRAGNPGVAEAVSLRI